MSFDKQTSILSERGVVKGAPRVKRQLSKKQEEELDKEIPKVSLFRVIKVNAPEWYLICLGLVGATINAAIFPAFAILFGEILTVFALPRNEVINGVHTYAGLFVMIAVVSAIAHFTKVREREREREREGGGGGGGRLRWRYEKRIELTWCL